MEIKLGLLGSEKQIKHKIKTFLSIQNFCVSLMKIKAKSEIIT